MAALRWDATFEVVRFSIAGDLIAVAAQVPGVYSIKPIPTDGGARAEMTNQICANNVNASNIAFPGYESWLKHDRA